MIADISAIQAGVAGALDADPTLSETGLGGLLDALNLLESDLNQEALDSSTLENDLANVELICGDLSDPTLLAFGDGADSGGTIVIEIPTGGGNGPNTGTPKPQFGDDPGILGIIRTIGRGYSGTGKIRSCPDRSAPSRRIARTARMDRSGRTAPDDPGDPEYPFLPGDPTDPGTDNPTDPMPDDPGPGGTP